MKSKQLDGRLTISRPSYGDPDKKAICIAVRDELSGNEFLRLEVSLADFAEALTGLSGVPAAFEVRALDRVGLLRQQERREVFCPDGGGYPSSEEREAWLVENCQEEGWILNPALRSQGSVRCVKDGTILSYSVTRYVEVSDEN